MLKILFKNTSDNVLGHWVSILNLKLQATTEFNFSLHDLMWPKLSLGVSIFLRITDYAFKKAFSYKKKKTNM